MLKELLEKAIESKRSELLENPSEFLTALQLEKIKTGKKTLDDFLPRLEKALQKSYEFRELEKYNQIMNCTEKLQDFTIVIEWKNSKTWGKCPQAILRYGVNSFESGIIGGCGYDKESSASARVLRQVLPIMKKLYSIANNALERGYIDFRSVFGYGCGYFREDFPLPYFESGVGINSHIKILGKIGYSCKAIYTNNTTIYNFTVEAKV